ncbi:MAG: RsmE family RNA methyltransferase [bacterium]
MEQAFLSEVELYYSINLSAGTIEIDGEEFHHIVDVMRHNCGDELYVTDGKGKIYKTGIDEIKKKSLITKIVSTTEYENILSNFIFCIPRLKHADRFEFAIEKCVELGITNFIVFESERTIAKGEKLERWQKIATGAMKQSLRAYLPKIQYKKFLSEILKMEGKKIIFDQNSSQSFSSFTDDCKLTTENFFLLFGPEGGFSNEEFRMMNEELKLKLTGNRLRSETAIISAASILSQS